MRVNAGSCKEMDANAVKCETVMFFAPEQRVSVMAGVCGVITCLAAVGQFYYLGNAVVAIERL